MQEERYSNIWGYSSYKKYDDNNNIIVYKKSWLMPEWIIITLIVFVIMILSNIYIPFNSNSIY